MKSMCLAIWFVLIGAVCLHAQDWSLLDFPPEDSSAAGLQTTTENLQRLDRQLKEDPDALSTATALFSFQRFDEALRVLRRVIETRPANIANALDSTANWPNSLSLETGHGYEETYAEIVHEATRRVSAMSREDAARTMYRALVHDQRGARRQPAEWRERQARFIDEYAGTAAADRVALDMTFADLPRATRFSEMERLYREHPSTPIAGRAAYGMAWDLAHNNGDSTPYTDKDPTERFLRMMSLVAELESGRFGDEWVAPARTLVAEFGAYEPRYRQGNITRVLNAYRAFVVSHFTPADGNSPGNGVGWIVAGKMTELAEMQGGQGAIDRLFASLARDVRDPDALRYLHAQFLMRKLDEARGKDYQPAVKRAQDILVALAENGKGPHRRRALGSLAMLHMRERKYEKAREAFERYVHLYPDSPWTWAATMRVAQCDEALGDRGAAARIYVDVASRAGSNLVSRSLGHAFAARNLESRSRFDDALREYRAALAAWDDRIGPEMSLAVIQTGPVNDAPNREPSFAIRKAQLVARIPQLERAVEEPGGILLEEGRWLLGAGERDAAIMRFERLLGAFPASSLAAEARSLAGRARLEQALMRADIDPQNDQAAAFDGFTRLAHDRDPFTSVAARIAGASISWKRGAIAPARTVMGQALADWLDRQPPARELATLTALERDVAGIRDAVFRPNGDGVYTRSGWNAFAWPSRHPPFVITSPEVAVTYSNGSSERVSFSQRFSGADRVLFLDGDHISLLSKMIVTLGGTQARVPASPTETPFQPVGPSLDVLALWNEFFFAAPWHWGGWIVATYPLVDAIQFADDARTRAFVKVVVGYSGGTILVEKEDGVWRARKFVRTWVT